MRATSMRSGATATTLRLSLAASIALALATAVVVAVALSVLLWWVLGRPTLAGGAPLSARDSFDLAKIVLAVVGGVGGVVALVVAFRRQRLGEAAEWREDERLYTDGFSRAVDQLGSDRAPVRLAALHVLERLGQDHPTKQQTITNVLCAYLRMPFPPADDDAGDLAHRQERQVRLTAQRALLLHLQPGGDGRRPRFLFWPNQDLDLTGATLLAFRFTDCQVRTGRFDDAVFVGECAFDRTRFDGNAWFRGAEFDGAAGFDGATFGRQAEFRGARFRGSARFEGARFTTVAGFDDVRFAVPDDVQGVTGAPGD